MKKPPAFDIRQGPVSCSEQMRNRVGFTLIEVVLVMVLMIIVSGISIPYFAGTFRGTKLRSAARTIDRVSRYARSMAIMREETLTFVLNHETMELFMGGTPQASTNAVQEVLKNLNYVKGASSDDETAGIDKEIQRFLPDGLVVKTFEKNWTEEDGQYENLYLIHYYPSGQCDWFLLELEDSKGMGLKLENDPISGKIRMEFLQ